MRHVVRQMVFVAAVAYLAGCAHDVTSSIFEINKVAGTGESKPAPINNWLSGGIAHRSLAKDKLTHILIEVDGGGIMGITPALVLADLEERLQNGRHTPKLRDRSDLRTISE